VGPCLEDVGTCFSDTNQDVGPCLEPPFDAGPCLSPPYDAGPDAEDAGVGPCLDIDPDAGQPDADVTMAPAPRPNSRAAVQSRLLASGVLPPDVAERLRRG
jgi:hypothetical protein